MTSDEQTLRTGDPVRVRFPGLGGPYEAHARIRRINQASFVVALTETIAADPRIGSYRIGTVLTVPKAGRRGHSADHRLLAAR